MKPELHGKGSITKRNDGYWLGSIYYYNEYGQRKRKAFSGKLKKTVKQRMDEFKAQFKKADEDYANKTTLKEALQEYLTQIKYYQVRRSTYDGIEGLMNTQINPRLGMKKIGDITSKDIQNALCALMSEGYSYSTTKKFYNLLGQLFRFMMHEGKLFKNPMDSITLMKEANFLSAQGKELKPKCDEITVLTAEEVAMLRKEAFSTNSDGSRKYPHAAAYFLMLNTGLRRGEVLGLRHSDIDLEKRVMHVNRSVKEVKSRNGTKADGKHELIVGSPKTSTSKRMLPLNDTAIKMIMVLRNEAFFGENSPLIPNGNGGIMHPNHFGAIYAKIVKECGLDKTALNCLRHTFATNLVNGRKMADGNIMSLPIKTVADLLGHTTTGITERYYIRRDNNNLKGLTDDFNI